MEIEPGSRWLERTTNRVVVILASCVHDTGPSWRYEDEPARAENWHYCDVFDFILWGRFVRLSPPAAGQGGAGDG